MPMTSLWWLFCYLQGHYQSPWTLISVRLVSGVTFVDEINASKTQTMIVSRSRTMHPQSHTWTIGWTVLNKSDDLDILGVTFYSNVTFEIYVCSVSRAADQRLGILKKSLREFLDRLLLVRCLLGFVLPVLEYCSAAWCSAADVVLGILNYWSVFSLWEC